MARKDNKHVINSATMEHEGKLSTVNKHITIFVLHTLCHFFEFATTVVPGMKLESDVCLEVRKGMHGLVQNVQVHHLAVTIHNP